MARNGQVVMYSGSAPSGSDVPADIEQPAVAYKEDGAGPVLTWDVSGQQWTGASDEEEAAVESQQPTGVFGGDGGVFGSEGGIF